MRRGFFVLWLLVVWRVAAWTFAPAPPPPTRHYDGRAFGPNEDIFVKGRQSTRRSATEALAQPWAELCADITRKKFISGLGYYYYQRENQTERHTETYGPAGANYIAQQWASADDQRIDRLTQDLYINGYLKPDEFDAVARKMIVAVVKDSHITGSGCAQ